MSKIYAIWNLFNLLLVAPVAALLVLTQAQLVRASEAEPIAPNLAISGITGAAPSATLSPESDPASPTPERLSTASTVPSTVTSTQVNPVKVNALELASTPAPNPPMASDSSPSSLSGLLEQTEQYASMQDLEGRSNPTAINPESTGGLGQVTSVTQMSDVSPTDWAYQSLQSLVERYGCIVGYPDLTYRGNRAITRYEFAAGLNACLDRVNELIAQGTANLVTKEDLLAIQRLQEEFAAELATIRGRIDAVETRVATLEAQQFSTTTKLSGLAWFNITGVGGVGRNNPLVREGTGTGILPAPGGTTTIRDTPNITFSNLVWLTLQTSFTGKDLLITQLAVGNGESPANALVSAGNFFNTTGVPFTDQTAGDQFTGKGVFVLRELSYLFPVSDRVKVVIGPRVNVYRFFDDNRFTFILNGVGSFNGSGSTLFNGLDRGAGGAVLINFNKAFSFRFGYFGESTEFLPFLNTAARPNPGLGLFGGTNTLIGELQYSPNSNLNFRFTYARTNQTLPQPVVGFDATEPTTGVYDGSIPGLTNASSNTFLVNFDWLVTKRFGVFGRYGIGHSRLNSAFLGDVGGVVTQSFQVGFGFPDLGKKGALGTVSFLMPYDVTNGRDLLISGAASQPGLRYATQYELEVNYYLPVTDNIAVVPNFQIIFNPNNISGNPTIYVYNLRTQFSF